MVYSNEIKEILNSSLFDQDWYKENFMKNDPSQLSPIDHFLSIGTFFDYPPSPSFSSYIYRLITNLEVDKNCLIDYLYSLKQNKSRIVSCEKNFKSQKEFYDFLKKRETEARKFHRNDSYISLKRNIRFLDKIKFIFYLNKLSKRGLYKLPIQLSYDYELIFRSNYFDEVFYSKTYSLELVDPIIHYLKHADVKTIFSHNFAVHDYYHHVKKLPGFQELPKLLKTKLLLHYEIFKNRQNLTVGIFPKNAEKVEFKKGSESKIIHRRACIFAMYSGDGRIPDETVFLLKSIKNFVDRIYVVSDSPLIPEEINKIKPYISFGLFNKHGLYDFGSYKMAFNELKTHEDLNNFDTILIANDSILGPTKPLSDFFHTYQQEGKPDLYGITINYFGYKDNLSPGFSFWSPHIQSYFVLISKRFFKSDTWTSFINKIQKKENKIDIIIDYEMGLTKLALKNGFRIGSYYKSKALNNPAASESASILENAFFLKKSLLNNKKMKDYTTIF